MKVHRHRYAFRSRSGHCWFEGHYPQVTGGAKEAAVNRLLAHVWRPDQRSACRGTSIQGWRQLTDFRVTAQNEQAISFRFHVRELAEDGSASLQRVEGFVVDLVHGNEVAPFRRAEFDALLAAADRPPPPPADGSPARPRGFYLRPTGVVLVFGDTREVHVGWEKIRPMIEKVPALKGFLPRSKQPPQGGGEAGVEPASS
jgi:hypothetical protein